MAFPGRTVAPLGMNFMASWQKPKNQDDRGQDLSSLLKELERNRLAQYQQDEEFQSQNQNQMQSGLDMLSSNSIAGGNGIGGGMASPSFMGGEGAGFTGADSIGGYSTGGILGGGAGAAGSGMGLGMGLGSAGGGAGFTGAGSIGGYSTGGILGAGGAGGATAGGGAAGGGFGGGMAAAGPYAALAALVAGGKLGQDKLGSTAGGRALHGAFLPSISQWGNNIKEGNWKSLASGIGGLPFLTAFFDSDETVETAPEWKGGLESLIGR